MQSDLPVNAHPPSTTGELRAWLRTSFIAGLAVTAIVLASLALYLAFRFTSVLTADGRGRLASAQTVGGRASAVYLLENGSLLNAPLADLKTGDQLEKRRFSFTYTVNGEPVCAISGWGRRTLIIAGVAGGLGFSFFILIGALTSTLSRFLERGAGDAS